MELKNKKYIHNTGKLPGFEDGYYAYDKSINYPRYTPIKDIGVVKTNPSDLTNNFKGFTAQSVPSGGISNFKKLPTEPSTTKVSTGSNINWGNLGNVITSGVDLYGSVKNDFLYDDTLSSINQNAGTYERNIGGLTYSYQNPLNYDDYVSDISKQNTMNTISSTAKGAKTGFEIGSLFPGVGNIVGTIGGALFGFGAGIMGGERRSEEAEKLAKKQIARAKNVNQFNRSSVLSEIADRNYYDKYGDTRQQTLYGAANGKQPVYSIDGQSDKEANAKVSSKEIIGNFRDGKVFRVPGEMNNDDTKYATLRNSDFVITNKHHLSDYAANTGDYIGALLMQEQLMNNKYNNKFKCGKLPKYYEGWIPNAFVSGLGMLGGLQQYLDAKGQDIKNPNTLSSNRYETSAINDLYRIKTNPYSIMPEIHEYYDKGADAIDRSGELRGGQKQLAKMKLASNTQNNIAKMLLSAQDQTNQYRIMADKAALSSGSESARLKTAANQWDLDYYSKAHAAKQQGVQMGIYNMMNQLQQYYANDFKRRQFNDTMDLYRQQRDLDKQRLLHDLYGSEPTSNPWTINPNWIINPNLSIKQEQDLFDADMRSHQQQFERDMKSRGFYYVPERANAIQRLAHDIYQRDQQSKNPNKKEIPVPDFSIINNLVQQRIKNSRNKRK